MGNVNTLKHPICWKKNNKKNKHQPINLTVTVSFKIQVEQNNEKHTIAEILLLHKDSTEDFRPLAPE